ncbi:MAG: restriction endonuclease subunit S [Ruminococcus sp.]|nr:restriction endonuclease subunit S [Ruminococcus sp.]
MSWQKVVLGDIANIQTGPFGSQLHQSDYSKVGIPVVMPKDLLDGKIIENSIAKVEEIHVERLSRYKIREGDIIYSRRGDVGRCAFAGKKEAGWLCGTGCLCVTIDVNKTNAKFVFYQLQLAETIGWVKNHAVGSTMLNLNTNILGNIPIKIPDLAIQNRIVSILSAYDDLIENNKKQIKLLEEMAYRR